eukprot:2867110-Rhodomonas_salina.3
MPHPVEGVAYPSSIQQGARPESHIRLQARQWQQIQPQNIHSISWGRLISSDPVCRSALFLIAAVISIVGG